MTAAAGDAPVMGLAERNLGVHRELATGGSLRRQRRGKNLAELIGTAEPLRLINPFAKFGANGILPRKDRSW